MASTSPTSPVNPLAPYPALPTEVRSRAPEFYGFVAWSGTYLLFAIFLLWALLPDPYIHALGVSWYPNRDWALLLPAYSIILVLLTYFTYFALAIAGTPGFSDLSTITDSRAIFPTPRAASSVPGDDSTGSAAANSTNTNTIPNPTANPEHASNSKNPNHPNPNPYAIHAHPDAVPEQYDIPIGLVNRVVYSRRRSFPSTPDKVE